MSDYKNVAMVNNPLVYWLSFTDGQLIPDPLFCPELVALNVSDRLTGANRRSGSGIRDC